MKIIYNEITYQKKICIRNIINDIQYPIFTIISSLSSRWLMIIMIYVISSSARLVHCYRPYRYTVSYPTNFYQNDKPCELPLIRLYSPFMISNLLYQTTWERGFFEIANGCIFFWRWIEKHLNTLNNVMLSVLWNEVLSNGIILVTSLNFAQNFSFPHSTSLNLSPMFSFLLVFPESRSSSSEQGSPLQVQHHCQ